MKSESLRDRCMRVRDSVDARKEFDRWYADNHRRIASGVSRVWWRYTRRHPSPTELEDLVQEAALAAWQAIQGYRWICAKCRERFEREPEFRAHAREVHATPTAEPLCPIERRVRYQEGQAAQTLGERALRQVLRRGAGAPDERQIVWQMIDDPALETALAVPPSDTLGRAETRARVALTAMRSRRS